MRERFRRSSSSLLSSTHPHFAIEKLLSLESSIRPGVQTAGWFEFGRTRFKVSCGELRDLPAGAALSTAGVLAQFLDLVSQVQ